MTLARADQRARLLDVALRRLEEAGPEALQASTLTAEIGTSTQAVYTLFGGMPGLFEALVEDGFARFADHVEAVEQTDDPVADFFAQGAAYVVWALAHPQLYRLMFSLAGSRLRSHADVMVRSLERVQAAGRIDPVDTFAAAGQFLSATHGYVLLQIAGSFGDDEGPLVLLALGINLMVGLGDSREPAEASVLAAQSAASTARA